MLTIDSGGQYLDGTIDTTRVLHFGTPTKEQQDIYTSLLQGCIDLVTTKFKPGTTLQELDPIIRKPLRDLGLSYGHGSTHGTGMYLTVHESFDYTYENNFIGSQEPGYYKENEFGMRLENLVQVTEVPVSNITQSQKLLTFESVTLVPYENKLINNCKLNKSTKKWLFSYYVIIRSLVGAEMIKQGRYDLYKWLIDKTDPTFKCFEISKT
uniref:Peptidase M24 domain-containing protein n=1 Tax=Clastoptera arizonana TaxID=38151 RepID=A0A1B6DT49_9HEMI